MLLTVLHLHCAGAVCCWCWRHSCCPPATQITRLLLSAGANPDLRMKGGQQAVDLATNEEAKAVLAGASKKALAAPSAADAPHVAAAAASVLSPAAVELLPEAACAAAAATGDGCDHGGTATGVSATSAANPPSSAGSGAGSDLAHSTVVSASERDETSAEALALLDDAAQGDQEASGRDTKRQRVGE